jgi:hypothetical protein
MDASGRMVSVALLFGALAGCTSIAPIAAPEQYISSKHPRTVWLTRNNHSVVRVDGPRLIGDTVVGSVAGEYTEVPLSEVTRAVAVQPSQGKTIAAALIGGGATAAALVVIFSHGGTGNNGGNDTIADTMTLQRQF